MFGNSFFGATYYGDPYFGPGSGTPPPAVLTDLGTGHRHRRRKIHPPVRPRDLDRHPEDILREQRLIERYLEEQERKAQPQAPATARPSERPIVTTPAVAPIPLLHDAVARAAAAEMFIAQVRSSSAERLAQAMSNDRRRVALLLLALD